jgi:cyclopropane-fatty-acyl-phospholipid synthase
MQSEAARARLDDRIAIYHGDYRQVLPRPATHVVSIGMYEHVGVKQSPVFFNLVRDSLPPGGRYLNQAIVRRERWRSRFRRNSFAQRYIFPNAQLRPISAQLKDLDRAGFRVLDVETFGPSYARTLRAWSRNLEDMRPACASLVGEPRVRAWEMYLAGARARFEQGHLDLAQVLAERR